MRGVGARPADALFLQRLDQRRLVVTRRRLREVLAGRQIEPIELLLVAQRRQRGVFLLAGRRKHLAIAVELQHLALGLEQAAAAACDGRRRQDLDVGDGEDGRRSSGWRRSADRSACTASVDRRANRAGQRAPACTTGRSAGWPRGLPERSCRKRRCSACPADTLDPYLLSMWARTACRASAETRVLSVRM